MALLELIGIEKIIQGSVSVKDIFFELQPLQKTAIAGETGSGKTTLLKLMAGLLQPNSGKVLLEGNYLPGPDEKLIPGHPHIAFLSQHFELRNNYWVHEILEYANLLNDEEANTLYEVCDIKHLIHRRTDQLSGGEKQRIALARLLSTSPKLLLLDEPFSNLDMLHKQTMQKVIHDIGERLDITCVMVSHDAPDVLSWAERILVMKDGRIVQQGTPTEIYYNPVDAYCAGLFGTYQLFDEKLLRVFGFPIDNIQTGKQLLVRPEQIAISTTYVNGVAAVVAKQLFWGSFYTVDVFVEGKMITIKTIDSTFVVGDIVYISLPPLRYCWL